MRSADVEITSLLKLQCANHTVIFRNESLENNYPGGLDAYINQHGVNYNAHITIQCVTVDTTRALEKFGMNQGKDFVAIDAVESEMWQMIHSDDIEYPFWLDTGADWLKCEHRNGRVLVWYDG